MHYHTLSPDMNANNIFDPKPYPELIADTTTKFLSLFGGFSLKSAPIAPYIGSDTGPIFKITDVLASIDEIVSYLSPLVEDAYRIDLSGNIGEFSLISSIQPIRKSLRAAPNTVSEWRLAKTDLQDFHNLQKIILDNWIEGRHTSFGIKPLKQQLLFLHLLDKDARKIPEFIGQLELKILEFLALQGKIHYLTQRDSVSIIMKVMNIEEKKKDDFMLYC